MHELVAKRLIQTLRRATNNPTQVKGYSIIWPSFLHAAANEIERLREALEVCAAGHIVKGREQSGIDWESLAREFNYRQQVATKALGRKTASELV